MFRAVIGVPALVAVSALLAACSGGEHRSSEAAVPTEHGTVAGHVRLEGTAPTVEALQVTVNNDVCGASARNERLEIGPNGGLAGAVVFIEVAGDTGAPAEEKTMDQVDCTYRPRIIVTTAGSKVRFNNSDPTAHNVRIEDPATGRILFNVAQPGKGGDEWEVPGNGAYPVLCDYHPWMNAYVVSVPSRYYAVTGSDGSFTIPDVPVGKRTVHVWFNGVGMKPKRDNQGQLLGYRFDEPVPVEPRIVEVRRDATTAADIGIHFGAR